MATKVVEVIFRARDGISAVTARIGGSISRFADKTRFSFAAAKQEMGSLVLGNLGWAALAAATVKAVAAAVDAADRYDVSVRRLAAASKLTGIDLGVLEANARRLGKELGISSVDARTFTGEIGKFAQAAGTTANVDKFQAALLDLAAAQGVSTERLVEGLPMLAEQDELLNRLGLANPSSIYEKYAASVGKTAARLTDAEKRQSIMNEVIAKGSLLTGEAARASESSAGNQARAIARIQDALGQFSSTIAPVRKLFFEFLAGAVDYATVLADKLIRVAKSMAVVVNAQMTYGQKFDAIAGIWNAPAAAASAPGATGGLDGATFTKLPTTGGGGSGGSGRTRERKKSDDEILSEEIQRILDERGLTERRAAFDRLRDNRTAPRGGGVSSAVDAQARKALFGPMGQPGDLDIDTIGITAEVDKAVAALNTLDARLKSVALTMGDTVGPVFADAFDAMVSGSASFGEAMLGAMRRAVAGSAMAKGREATIDALRAAGQGFLGDPRGFAAAGKFAAAAAGYYGLAAALGGGGGNRSTGGGAGGGGALSPAGASRDASTVTTPGLVTVVLPAGPIDPTNLAFQDGLRKMIESMTDRRVVFAAGGG
jgi:hypothetical protein